MDNPGWHALRKEQRDSLRAAPPHRGPDGRYQPVEQIQPMDEAFIGGFHPDMPAPPTPPPKDPKLHQLYSRHRHGVPSQWTDEKSMTATSSTAVSSSQSRIAGLNPVERSQAHRVARMEPHLQFMVGPLLRYDTVDESGTWCGAAMIVTADSGSIYEPYPTLFYHWDPDAPVEHGRPSVKMTHKKSGKSFDLGPHPADPTSVPLALNGEEVNGHGAQYQKRDVPGQEMYVFPSNQGTFTFWRFLIQVPLTDNEMKVTYCINHGQQLEFYVPGRNQNMRWAAHSCNGFSAGVNQDLFRGPGFQNGYDPVWTDLLMKHAEEPFHVLVGGGDQLYCDALTREPEMQEWVVHPKPEEKKALPLTEEMESAIDRFFFNHYCKQFRLGAFARANCSIPMVNMCDDHDLIDGFGSYPDDLQRAPVFRHIGTRGYFYFLLFQCFINPDLDGLDDTPGRHCNKSLILGQRGPYISYPSHSFLTRLGPETGMLLLDCRAERKKDQVCSPEEYQKVFARLRALPNGLQHLIVQIGIPIAYPRMVFMERALESKFNPLVALGKAGSMGMSGFVNKFNAEAELLDDLNDHWTAQSHKKERNWFVGQMQAFAQGKRVRVSFISGDVHCAAVGVFKTHVKDKKKKDADVPPATDHRYMINIVTSAIVNTPPPNGVISMVSTLATKTHRTMHGADTDEGMLPVFATEPASGGARKQKFIMGARNWTAVRWDAASGDVVFDIRVEKERGYGVTTGYEVRTPPPKW